jgi:hypothetical protein
VAIFEQRNEEIEILNEKSEKIRYFSKPYEPFCKENIAFMLKYLSSINYENGISPIISDSIVHSSLYKHFKFQISLDKSTIKAKFTLAYVTFPTKLSDLTLL